MTSLDDQVYQLFSLLVKNSKSKLEHGLSFQEKSLTIGNGPYINETQLYLGHRSSLLGHGHPLTYKCRLESSLSPFIYADKEEQIHFFKEFNQFLHKITGHKLYATPYGSPENTIWDAARYSTFLSEESLAILKKGKNLFIPNLFSFLITLTMKEDEVDQPLAYGPFLEAKALLKLLSLGDFYGKDGHIHQMSALISQELTLTDRVKSVKGLILNLDPDKNYSFLEKGKSTVYLPLFFSPPFIKDLNKIIME